MPESGKNSCALHSKLQSQWQLGGSRAGVATGEPGGDKHLLQIPGGKMEVRGLLFPEMDTKWLEVGIGLHRQASFCLHFSAIFLPPVSLEKCRNNGRKLARTGPRLTPVSSAATRPDGASPGPGLQPCSAAKAKTPFTAYNVDHVVMEHLLKGDGYLFALSPLQHKLQDVYCDLGDDMFERGVATAPQMQERLCDVLCLAQPVLALDLLFTACN